MTRLDGWKEQPQSVSDSSAIGHSSTITGILMCHSSQMAFCHSCTMTGSTFYNMTFCLLQYFSQVQPQLASYSTALCKAEGRMSSHRCRHHMYSHIYIYVRTKLLRTWPHLQIVRALKSWSHTLGKDALVLWEWQFWNLWFGLRWGLQRRWRMLMEQQC